ncbi:thermopsin precursor, partial [mine drainage metagenome]
MVGDVEGGNESGTGPTIAFTEPNGTYAYSIATSDKTYRASGGTFTVNETPLSILVIFNEATYPVTFVETDLPSGTSWSVTLEGVTELGTGPTITFTEPSGTYGYSIADVPGWHQTTMLYTGSVTVSGGSVTEPTLAFSQVTYTVTFTESGLPSGTSWSATVSGVTRMSTTGSITFTGETNGTYAYSIGDVPGWHQRSVPYSGSFNVSGAGLSVSTDWTVFTYAVTFAETGLVSGTNWSVTLNGVTEAGPGPTITFTEPNGTYAYATPPLANWYSPGRGTVVVAGQSRSVPVPYQSAYLVTFTASGLASGTNWSLTIMGSSSAVAVAASSGVGAGVDVVVWSGG